MIGLYVTVPVACFRKALTREYLETSDVPPPATCYGFLLSLVGEKDRLRHIGARVTAGLLDEPDRSVVLRTVWRVKSRPLGSAGNTRPDYQQLLSGVRLVIWLDSSDENISNGPDCLESRVEAALAPERRGAIERFGGLSLGESTHLVDEVSAWPSNSCQSGRVFLLSGKGKLTAPVWVDHVGSAGTNYVTGELRTMSLAAPEPSLIPRIEPKT
mgnify:CR=1 FL=1